MCLSVPAEWDVYSAVKAFPHVSISDQWNLTYVSSCLPNKVRRQKMLMKSLYSFTGVIISLETMRVELVMKLLVKAEQKCEYWYLDCNSAGRDGYSVRLSKQDQMCLLILVMQRCVWTIEGRITRLPPWLSSLSFWHWAYWETTVVTTAIL